MRTILIIIKKEFIQVLRNKTMLPIIFVIPIIQLLILVHAATYEMKNIRLCVIDDDKSSTSRDLIQKFEASPFFQIEANPLSMDEAEKLIKSDKVDIIVKIPNKFEKKLIKENNADIQYIVNAINGSAAGLINAYTMAVISSFNKNIVIEWINKSNTKFTKSKSINIQYSNWYNPELDYITFMLPGILALLITIIGMFLSGMSLVREKEIGTIEQINVTPIRKYQFIAGKLIPFWIIALFELALGLTIGKLLFNIPMLGEIWLVFLSASVYLLLILSLGLFVSTITNTQQQAMFISFFLLMVFVLMSGLFTSIESMPVWGQWLNKINPIAYFIKCMRMILLKGSTFANIAEEFFSLLIYGILMLSLAVWRYKKTS